MTKNIKSIFGFSIPSLINMFVSFLVLPFVTRLFSPEDLGKLNLFFTYTSIIATISMLGIDQGYIRFFNEVPGRNSSRALFKLSIYLVTISSIFVCLLIFINKEYFSIKITGENIINIPIMMCISIIFIPYINLSSAMYRMKKNVIAYSILSILLNLCTKVSYVGAALINSSYKYSIAIFTVSNFALGLFYLSRSLYEIKGEKVYIGKEEVFPVLKYSSPFLIVMLLSQINTSLPKILISEHLTFKEVGIFSSAQTIVGIISIVQIGLNLYWSPFVYENYKEKNIIFKAHELILFSLIAFGLFILLFQDIIYLIIGINYKSSQKVFALLLFSPICYTISETMGFGINLSKKSYLNLIVYISTIISNFVLCLILIPKFKLFGAGISVAISSLVMLIVKTLIGEKYYKITYNYNKSYIFLIIFLFITIICSIFIKYVVFRFIIVLSYLIIFCLINKNNLKYLLKNIIKVLIIK